MMLGTSFAFGCFVPVSFKFVSPQNGLQLSIFGINKDPLESIVFLWGPVLKLRTFTYCS